MLRLNKSQTPLLPQGLQRSVAFAVIIALLGAVGSSFALHGVAWAQSGEVAFSLDPPAIALAQGEVVEVSVVVDPSGQPVDAVQVFLDYDPALLQVVDANGAPTSAVTYGSIITDGTWKQPLLNEVDPDAGRIGVAAGIGYRDSGGVDATNQFVLATVYFKALVDRPITELIIDLEDVQTIRSSKAYSAGVDVTGPATKTVFVAGPDSAVAVAPALSSPSVLAKPPANQQIDQVPVRAASLQTDPSLAELEPRPTTAPGVSVQPKAPPSPNSDQAVASNEGDSLPWALPVAIISLVLVIGLVGGGMFFLLKGRRSAHHAASRGRPVDAESVVYTS